MALEVLNLKRVFSIDKGSGKVIQLADPNPDLTPEEVMKFHSSKYPELTNAKVEGPKVANNSATYTFTTKAGKLG